MRPPHHGGMTSGDANKPRGRINAGWALVLGIATHAYAIGEGAALTPRPEPSANAAVATQDSLKLGLSYPPMRDAAQLAFTAQHLEALDVRLVRYEERWENREPAPGRFHWAPLDARMAFVRTHGLSLLLNIRTSGPDWAVGPRRNAESAVCTNAPAFSNFVSTLVLRYRGDLAKLQFGNEWQGEHWYIGSAADYVYWQNLFYDTVKAHAPEIPVVLGGLSVGSLRALAVLDGRLPSYRNEQGRLLTAAQLQRLRQSPRMTALNQRVQTVLSQARYDILDLHLYDDVEHWPLFVAAAKARAPLKPIIVSEFGGPNPTWETYSDAYQAERLDAYVQMLTTLGISEAYYFTLVRPQAATSTAPHQQSTLIGTDLQPKPAYEVFRKHSRGQYAPGEPQGEASGDAPGDTTR